MVYPGEKKDRKEYQDYVAEIMGRGETPLSEQEWREKIKNSAKDKTTDTALSSY